jgi:hypothetical protein
MLTIENTEAKLRNRDHFYRAEQAEAQLAEAHKVVNRCAAQVGHPPIAPGEIGIESVAEAVERHAAHAREREEALDSITPQNLRAFAASEAHHEEHHEREKELESQVASWKAAHERAAVIAAEEADRQTAELRAQLAEAKRETATQARVAANLTNQAMEQLNRAEQAEARTHEAEGYLRVTRASLNEVEGAFLKLQTRYESEHAALAEANDAKEIAECALHQYSAKVAEFEVDAKAAEARAKAAEIHARQERSIANIALADAEKAIERAAKAEARAAALDRLLDEYRHGHSNVGCLGLAGECEVCVSEQEYQATLNPKARQEGKAE